VKQEVRFLRDRAVASLLLAIELFNRPSDRGRQEAVLIHADHAFELLLKAVIVHKGGRIRRPREANTIGFEACVCKCLSEEPVKCLSESDAVALRTLNGWRDAAQHYYLVLPESQLYMATQGAVTLFDDLLQRVFGEGLRTHLPERVLPISVDPPRDLGIMLDDTFRTIVGLLGPGTRKASEAKAHLRPIAILESAAQGSDASPTEGELRRALGRLRAGDDWRTVFPGVACLRLDSSGSGLTYNLRITKHDGVPVHRVAEGVGVPVVERRVSELDYYNLGFMKLAGHFRGVISPPRLRAVISEMGLRESDVYFKELVVNGTPHALFSQKAIGRIREELPNLDVDGIWANYQAVRKRHSN
jgi:hypothetical protein